VLRLAGQFALLEREALIAAGGLPAGGQSRTRLAVVVNADSLATWFLPALATLPQELAISFDVREDDQDHTAELLRDGSVMAAVTAQQLAVQGCRVERLGAMRYLAVASPGLAETYFSGGVTPAALAAAPMLVFNRKDRLQHRFLRTLSRRKVAPPTHYVPSVWGFGEAIRLGLGWGMEPEQLARPKIADGRCVEFAAGRHLDVPLYWQHWRLDSTILDAVTAVVRTAAAETLR
jgi:LysR family transcriptional regulator (chromosome initiation inhibitor)